MTSSQARRSAATVAGALLAAAIVPAPAVASSPEPYKVDLRATAVEAAFDGSRPAQFAVGYSRVSLGSSDQMPFCSATGAGAHDGGRLEEPIVPPPLPFLAWFANRPAARSSPGGSGGLFNPTVAHDTPPTFLRARTSTGGARRSGTSPTGTPWSTSRPAATACAGRPPAPTGPRAGRCPLPSWVAGAHVLGPRGAPRPRMSAPTGSTPDRRALSSPASG